MIFIEYTVKYPLYDKKKPLIYIYIHKSGDTFNKKKSILTFMFSFQFIEYHWQTIKKRIFDLAGSYRQWSHGKNLLK